MLKIAVLVSGGGSNLQAILDSASRGEIINGKVYAVISSREDAYALKRAEAAGVEHIKVISPKDFESRGEFTAKITDTLKSLDIDLVVLAGFMHVLSDDFCREYRNRVMNVHPSLIPAFCGDGYYGLRVHKSVLDYGVKVTGATVHFVNEVTDGGPIILQKSIEVRDGDTPEKLQRRVMEECEWVLLPEAVSLFCQGRLEVCGNHVYIK
jgi:phosphoribosylglycinamide formyltransferase-1